MPAHDSPLIPLPGTETATAAAIMRPQHNSSNLTSSQTGTLYFAYGSNLSPEQMAGRCVHSPATSSEPIAVARLDGWRWIICQRGYANVVPCRSQNDQARVTTQLDDHHVASVVSSGARHEDKGERQNDDNVVYGLVYNMSRQDEVILDSYEGHDVFRNPDPEPNLDHDPWERRRKPFLQGAWDYNKLYMKVRVMRWLKPLNEDYEVGVGEGGGREGPPQELTVLVYVDELRMGEGPVQPQYVGRMNRAIEQGVAAGIPRDWIERVMRRWIVKGAKPEKGYVGRRDGYWSE